MTDILKHLDLNSADGTQLNLDALYQIAPSAFTEVRDDKTGEISRKGKLRGASPIAWRPCHRWRWRDVSVYMGR